MATSKVRALKRKQVFINEPTIRQMTIDEIVAWGGDPRAGQKARYGVGEDQVDRLWNYKDLAVEVHRSPQATMLGKINLEFAEDEHGKIIRTGGNRSQLALMHLRAVHGTEDVQVTIESEVDGRPLKMTHTKNYGVTFPVKFYGKLNADQLTELEDRDDRAVLKSSKGDFYYKGWQALKSTAISTQPSKEKLLVQRLGAGNVNRFFPQKRGLKKDGSPYLPAVSVDETTGEITSINNREAIQTIFRMFELPDCVALAVVAGETGEGPKIPLRALSAKLIPAWIDDKKKTKGRLNNSMSLEEIEEILPESSLVANVRAVTATKERKTKITPYSGAEMKKLEGLAGGSTLLVAFLKVLQRDPSHAHETVLTSVIEAMTAAEKALGAGSPSFKKLFDAITEASKKEDEESEEEVDPETGEPLADESDEVTV